VRPPARTARDLCNRIRDALVMLGGEAHRTTVIETVARDFGIDIRNIPDELQTAMILSFEQVWRDEEQRAAYGFHLRFGEGSHRWALKPEELQVAIERQSAAAA
jgi:uncharacterized protein with PIN domain